MTFNVRKPDSQLSSLSVLPTAALVVLLGISSAPAQCSGGGGGGRMPPPAPGQFAAGGSPAAGVDVAGLQQIAALTQQAQQQRLQQMRVATMQRQRQLVLQQQLATGTTVDRDPARPPRSNTYVDAAQRRRAAYLRARETDMSGTSQSVTLAGR